MSNYLERCLKRLENTNDIETSDGEMYSFSGLHVVHYTYREDDYWATFNGVKVPLSFNEAKELYTRAQDKFVYIEKQRELNILKDL